MAISKRVRWRIFIALGLVVVLPVALIVAKDIWRSMFQSTTYILELTCKVQVVDEIRDPVQGAVVLFGPSLAQLRNETFRKTIRFGHEECQTSDGVWYEFTRAGPTGLASIVTFRTFVKRKNDQGIYVIEPPPFYSVDGFLIDADGYVPLVLDASKGTWSFDSHGGAGPLTACIDMGDVHLERVK